MSAKQSKQPPRRERVAATSHGWEARRVTAARTFKPFDFGSIRTRLMTATALLIVAIVGVVVYLWAQNVRDVYRQRTVREARSIAVAIAYAYHNELIDKNWSQVRVMSDAVLIKDPDFVYVLVTAGSEQDRIVAATPARYADQFVPTLVRNEVSRASMVEGTEARVTETWLLEDVEFPAQHVRGRRGDKILEVAADIPIPPRPGRTGVLRIGVSLEQMDRAVAAAVKKALLVGLLGLIVGLLGAYVLAERMARPIMRLQASATQIASGDLKHRAEVQRADEIGGLAASFNEMAGELQLIFDVLKKTLASFRRFVPEKFLQVIAPDGEREYHNIQVGVASVKRISVLFSDIRGYTSLSETMTPRETFEFLNEYLGMMGEVIDQAGGFIDKYIGDAIMALSDDEHTDGIVRAALAMRARLAHYNETRVARGLKPIDTGIGIHTGEVVMGTIGFKSKIESTVIGDTVNLASRLEGLTKDYQVAILVTETVVKSLAEPSAYLLRLVDAAVKVKGKSEPIAIYELSALAKAVA